MNKLNKNIVFFFAGSVRDQIIKSICKIFITRAIKYHVFEDDSLLFVSLCSRFCLYIWPRKDNRKGEEGLEGEEDEEVAPAWPNPKMVSRDRS